MSDLEMQADIMGDLAKYKKLVIHMINQCEWWDQNPPAPGGHRMHSLVMTNLLRRYGFEEPA